MYLHLGQDYIVPLQNVVAVFDMDTATMSGRTQRLLSRLQDEGLSPQALQRRAEKAYAI